MTITEVDSTSRDKTICIYLVHKEYVMEKITILNDS